MKFPVSTLPGLMIAGVAAALSQSASAQDAPTFYEDALPVFMKWWRMRMVSASRSTLRTACTARPVILKILPRTSPGLRQKAAAVQTIQICKTIKRAERPFFIVLIVTF